MYTYHKIGDEVQILEFSYIESNVDCENLLTTVVTQDLDAYTKRICKTPRARLFLARASVTRTLTPADWTAAARGLICEG